MKVWWCNQTRWWNQEREAGIVGASRTGTGGAGLYRWMVWLAHKGDVIVHYRSSPRLAVVALSRAATDARSGKVPLRGYGRGWYFETEYFKLKNPIRREAFLQRLRPLEIEYGPVLSNGRVREGYFMPFSGLGLSCLQELSRDEWPRWARQAARQR